MIYPFTFYTDRRLKDWQAGATFGPVILIRPKYREDVGLLEHEKMHVKQWWFTLGLHALLYWLSKRYRLWAEAKAYAEQMRWPDRFGNRLSLQGAASRLALPEYGFGITPEQAQTVLEKLNGQ